jgi:hypothetical protein
VKNCGSEKPKIAGGAWNVERAGKRQGFAGRRLDVVKVLAADGLNELPVDEVSNLQWFSAHGREILGVVVAKSMPRGELKRRTPGRLTLSDSGSAQVLVV